MGIILGVVLIVMCGISYYEELNTVKQISSFQSMIAIDCTVIRCARKLIVPASDLIIGDLVWIQNGDRIPADMRLIYCDDLQIETSWLSGEVEPLPYTDEPATEDKGVFESQNVVFSGCSVTSGHGLGLVIRIGNSTVLGNLVEITSKEKSHKAPLQIEHHRFVLFISISAIIVATVSFLLGLILTNFSHILSTFVNGFLIVLVAWVPQGLPVTLTAQLLIVARRLAKFGMYLKRLECADTLGITSILMVDKTGVLTQNDLRVTDLWTLENSVSAKTIIESHQKSLETSNSSENNPKYHISDGNCNLISGVDDIFGILITVMSICDKAIIENSHHSAKIALPRKTPSFRRKNLLSLNPEDLTKSTKSQIRQTQFSLKHKDLKEKSVIGKSLDVALVKFVENVTSVDKIRDDYDIVFEVPFSSQRRYHLVPQKK
uniref:P-type ATPase A domain-containing protein n=1 Tax=Panagrolaimus superbus TaxID=310955 RepID=A0A914YFV8_9BILA